MPDFTSWDNFPILSGLSHLLGLEERVVAMAMLSASLGALIVTRFTTALGIFAYLINYVILLAGALLAHLIMARVSSSLDHSLERSLIISVAGMAVASLVSLVLLTRGRLRD